MTSKYCTKLKEKLFIIQDVNIIACMEYIEMYNKNIENIEIGEDKIFEKYE